MNYYELLEVNPRASTAVIRAAYKSLMQRYHPDKNLRDPQCAQMASLIVQAFEVLSDEGKRRKYDRELRSVSQAPLRRARSAAPGTAKIRAGLGALALAVPVVAVSAWLFVRLTTPSSSSGQVDAPAAQARSAPRTASRDLPKLLVGLSITLAERDTSNARNRVLEIPNLGVRVGTRDPESAIRHVENMASTIEGKLSENLSAASYAKLIGPEGEQYLAGMILATVRQVTGTIETADAAPETDPVDRYGVIEVSLPQSFSVR